MSKYPVPKQNIPARNAIAALADKVTECCGTGELEEAGNDPGLLKHYFAPGVYVREYFIAKGNLIIGKIHKTAHMNIILQGDVTVVSQYGQERYKAPHTFQSPVGTQRAIYAHEDSIWTTIHPTTLTDVDEIEEQIIAKSFDEIDALLLENELGGDT